MLQKIHALPKVREEQTSTEEGQSVPKMAQAAKSELLVAVKWRERPSIPSIYTQRLLMGPKYNVATCVDELGSTKSYWRSKRLSKRVKVPNLAQTAKLELFAPVKRR